MLAGTGFLAERHTEVFRLNIGGSEIKGAPVEVESGELPRNQARVPTPEAAKPHEAAVAVEVVSRSG
jgi:polyphosphate glucokinase